MSKAVLVLDMPQTCKDCPLNYSNDCDDSVCIPTENLIYPEWIEENRKPDWCPLYELPQKKNVAKDLLDGQRMPAYYEMGWNACVEELANMGGKAW